MRLTAARLLLVAALAVPAALTGCIDSEAGNEPPPPGTHATPMPSPGSEIWLSREPGTTAEPTPPEPPPSPPTTPPANETPTPTTPPPTTWPPKLKLTPHATGLTQPVGLVAPGDGSGRLFVLEQTGRVWILRDGKRDEKPFLDVSALTKPGGERGLLGLAFHPRFTDNGHVYVSYTDLKGDSVLARYAVSADDPDRADPGTATTILRVDQPYGNHNGGHVVFGPDGKLYYGLGDGGSGGDPKGNAQNPKSLLGKLLRLDVNGATGYTAPPDNPYAARGGGRDEIWALGLRNPWRFSFDRETGDLYIADVGQSKVEEVNFAPAGSPGGANYGWNAWEGNTGYKTGAKRDGYTFPVAEIKHGDGGSCAITGGHVYRGTAIPPLQGTYLFGDYCSGTIWGLRNVDGKWTTTRLLKAGPSLSSFGEDETGEILVVNRGGTVHKLVQG